MAVDRRRILAYCAVGGLGGPVQSILAVRDALSRYVVSVAVGAWSADARRKLEGGSPELRVVEVARPLGLGTMVTIWQLMRTIRLIDRQGCVIHANGLTELAVLTPVLASSRLPTVVWIHNSEAPRSARALRPMAPWLRRRVVVAAVSSLAARTGHAVLGPECRIEIIPNPVPRSVLGRWEPPRTGALRVAYLGTDRAHKGFDYLVDVVERTAGRFVWTIACRPYAADPRQWERLIGLRDRGVRVVGRVLDVAKIYSTSDVVFVPSRSESFCRVAAEALANGLFVVASDLQPLRDMESFGKTLRLFPVGDVDGAIQHLEAVALLAPEYRRAMGIEVGTRVRMALSPEGIARRLEALYDEAIGGPEG